jgi:hypothetical protein
MVRQFCIYGERCSGTNILLHAIKSNSGLIPARVCGSKHWPQIPNCQEKSLLKQTAIIIATRHPVQWLRSLYLNPWHAAPDVRARPFPDFFKSEWWSVWDGDAGVRPWSAIYGTEMMQDRNPFTGMRYSSPIEMRAIKYRICFEIAEHAKIALLIPLEAYAQQMRHTIHFILEAIGCELPHDIIIPHGYKSLSKARLALAKVSRLWKLKQRENGRKPEVTATNISDIWRHSDPDLEHAFGYTPNTAFASNPAEGCSLSPPTARYV